ncbi:putative acetyl-CoA synthetase [Trichoderma camerunense]
MASSPVYVPPRGLHTYMDDFREYISRKHLLDISSYNEFHQFSVERANDFWLSLCQYLQVKASVHPVTAVDEKLRIDHFPQFYQEARLNYAENILANKSNGVAIKYMDESTIQTPRSVTWRELNEMVRQVVDAMQSTGLCVGDTVVVIGGNSIKSLTLLLAAASLGALFCSFNTDLGEKALKDRLGQLYPRLVFVQTEYSYNGKPHSIAQRISKLFSAIEKSNLAEMICYEDTFNNPTLNPDAGLTMVNWLDFIKRGIGRPLVFKQVPFNHPLVVMFSSGTTGSPKGIVHSHGGLVINGLKENRLHNNFSTRDTYFHYTNIGWTLWNISLGALFCGSTLVLYDGSPFYPSPSRFLQSIFAMGVTAFGAGPRYFEELRNAAIDSGMVAIDPFTGKLDLIVSTGAILTTSLSLWIAKFFGPVCQVSMSGGTELCGSFVHGTKALPTWPGQITVKALGLDIDVFSPDGHALEAGQMGELVCKKPFPNMPVSFLHDADKKRYFNAYFSQIPGVWTHGDLIKIDPLTNGLIILGRSDGVLNPNGVRFGSSEIYAVLEQHFSASVKDSLCVGQQRQERDLHERVILFVKFSSSQGEQSRSQLKDRIRQKIAEDLSRRHMPHFIFEVNSIPYNANGKKMETQVKSILNRGKDALLSMKVSDAEKASLESFVKFFDIESLSSKSEKSTNNSKSSVAKL